MHKAFLTLLVVTFLTLISNNGSAARAGQTTPSQTTASPTASFPRVDDDLRSYDVTVAKMREEFSKIPANPTNITWVQENLKHMVEVDQFMRKYMNKPHERGYSEAEREYFFREFSPRFQAVDEKNKIELQALLKIHDWFIISKFGAVAESQAWLIVQHADHDPEFQKSILSKLEKLVPLKETEPANYAYLYDRVAASWSNPSAQKPQRYGTQGMCVGPGKWEPLPIENPEDVDARRAEVGLGPLKEYMEMFKDVCH